MSAFNSPTAFNAGGAGAGAPAGTPLMTILKMALRLAHVTKAPGRGPSIDQLSEAFTLANLMLSHWNTSRLRIPSIQINAYPLTGAKIYTIGGPGLGANFNVPRPQKIVGADVILIGNPNVRYQMRVIEEPQWRAIGVQDIPGGIPSRLYSDRASPITSLYVFPQDPGSGYQLELYTWLLLQAFVGLADVISLPPGYDDAITYNLALRLADTFETVVSENTYAMAAVGLGMIESLNSPVPRLCNDAAGLGDSGRGNDAHWWLTGGYGG
jgi:hypothetical protein